MLKYATLAYSIKGHIISARLQAGTGMIGGGVVVEATPEAMTRPSSRSRTRRTPLADEPAAHRARQAQGEEAQVQARRGAGDGVALGPERHAEDR